MSQNRFAIQRSKLLSERFQTSFKKILEERIANNSLISKLDKKEILLKFNPIVQAGDRNHYDFLSKKVGTVADINLQALELFAEILEKEAKQNGYSFSPSEVPNPSTVLGPTPKESTKKVLIQNESRYLVKKFHDSVTETSKVLITVDKNILKNSNAIGILESLVAKAFIIDSKKSFADEMQAEITGLSDQIMNAMRAMKYGKVKELTNLYLGLAVGFLDTVARCQGGTPSATARVERSSFYPAWPQVNWLKSGIMDFFRVAFNTKDIENIDLIMYLPISIALRSIDRDDHYVFQEFIQFAAIGYELGSVQESAEIRSHSIDRSWRFINEISRYYIEGRMLQGGNSLLRVESLKDFGIEVFVLFEELMKRSFDKRDFDSFSEFVATADSVLRDFEEQEEGTDSETIRTWLKDPQINEDVRRRLEGQLEDQTDLETWKLEIKARRGQMFFGMAAWILASHLSGATDTNEVKYFDKIKSFLPSSIEDLTRVFLSAHDFDTEHLWGWDFWGMKADGEVREIRALANLETLYAVWSLTLLGRLPAASASNVVLPHSRDLLYLAEGTRDLLKVLDSIRDDAQRWMQVLTMDAQMNVNLFKSLLAKARDAQLEEESLFKRSQPLSNSKVEDFKNGFIQGFNSEVILRAVFTKYGALEIDLTGLSEDVNRRFGINTLEDKGAFQDVSPIHYIEWGQDYGRNFALSENRFIFEQLANKCIDVTSDTRSLNAILEERGNLDSTIIIGANLSFHEYFRESNSFISEWTSGIEQYPIHGWDGYLEVLENRVPLLAFYTPKLAKQLLLLNTDNLGRLAQLSPLASEGERVKLRDFFYIDVASFSQNDGLLSEFLANPPKWLLEKGESQEQREYLESRVRVQIFENFDFEAGRFSGLKILLGEDGF